MASAVRVGDVTVWLAPAGHVLGSAQVVLEHGGMRVVVSGDYKRRFDPTCTPFQVVPCDVFVTEATFGLPVFVHPPDGEEIGKLLHSLALFPESSHRGGRLCARQMPAGDRACCAAPAMTRRSISTAR